MNSFAIKVATVPFRPPRFHSRLRQVPVLQRPEPFEPSAPPSAVELSDESPQEHAAEFARPSSVKISRHHSSPTLEHSTASSPASPLVAALLDRLRRIARPLDLQDLRRRSLVSFFDLIHIPFCSVVLGSGRVFTLSFSFVFLSILDLREEIGLGKPVVS
jgi:hypothetical protein